MPATWILGRDDWLSRQLLRGLARCPAGGEGAGSELGRIAPDDIGADTALASTDAGDVEDAIGALATADDAAQRLADAHLVVTPSVLADRRGLPVPEPASRLLRLCAERRPATVVVLSSFAAHEPSHHHPGLVAESFPVAGRFGNPIPRRWRAIEAAAVDAFAGRCPATILRIPPLPAPDGRCVLSRLLSHHLLPARLALVAPGFDPQIQVLDPDDLAAAVRFALAHHPGGVLQVAPAGTVPLRAALRLAGRRVLPVPLLLLRLIRGLGRGMGAWSPVDRHVAGAELDFLRFPATQSDAALRRLGWAPRYTSAESLLRWCGVEGSIGGDVEGEEPRAIGAPPPRFDDWGMSPDFVRGVGRTVFRFLRRVWFRMELDGLEHVPMTGPVVLVGAHRGFVPLDAMLTLDALVRERGRWPRFLVHPGLLRWPWIALVITRLGGVVACRENAERVLAGGGVLGVFPEGLNGPFRLQRDAHRVGRFLSDDFVDWARRHRAPLVPFVTMGAAEAFPILGRIDSRWWRRKTEWPFLPITPTLLPLPLPVKWRIRFLEPIAPGMGPTPPSSRRQVSDRVRNALQGALAELLAQRRSVLRG